MNKPLTLPPISTLLNEAPRIIIQPNSPTSQDPFIKSPAYLSPLLSPISYASSITRSPSPPIYALPPIHGDDPPQSLHQAKNYWNSRHSYLNKTQEQVQEKSPKKEPPPDLPPFTQIIMSESGQAILKRRRGRPPSMKPYLEGSSNWTFLTPTVWDVNHDPVKQDEENVMNGSMAAFTSSSMDMVLQMPRKKRGRKPKSHIQGHSCFVWKDIPASKRVKKQL